MGAHVPVKNICFWPLFPIRICRCFFSYCCFWGQKQHPPQIHMSLRAYMYLYAKHVHRHQYSYMYLCGKTCLSKIIFRVHRLLLDVIGAQCWASFQMFWKIIWQCCMHWDLQFWYENGRKWVFGLFFQEKYFDMAACTKSKRTGPNLGHFLTLISKLRSK